MNVFGAGGRGGRVLMALDRPEIILKFHISFILGDYVLRKSITYLFAEY